MISLSFLFPFRFVMKTVFFSLTCSTSSTSPISWLVDGPRTLYHDFSASMCEINLRMTIYNSSDGVASVRIGTFDSVNSADHLNDGTAVSSAYPSGDQAGWHDASIVDEIKVTSDVHGARVGKSLSLDSVPPFIWSGTSSTRIKLGPKSASEIPLQICVFSPGIYNLSNYALHWRLLTSDDSGDQEGTSQSSGTCQGYPYYLIVLQLT